MPRYINGHGKNIIVCDQCLKDMVQGDNVYAITLNKVADGYTTRNFDKRDTLLCLECAHTISQVLVTLKARYANCLTVHQSV